MLLILMTSAWGQTPPPYNLQISQQPLPPVNNLFANYTGTQGQLTYYYWIVAIYGVGNSALSPIPAMVTKIDSSGSVSIGWSNPANPTGYSLTYDVLRTTSNVQFQSCSNCLVASGTSLLTTTDTLKTLSGYSVSTYIPQPNPLVITLDNINARQVLLKGFINGSNIIPIGPGATGANQIWFNDSNGIPTGSTGFQFDGTNLNFGSTAGISGSTNVIRIHPISGNNASAQDDFPSGTGTAARINLYNTNDVTNSGRLRLIMSGTAISLISNITGSGSAATSFQIGEDTTGLGALAGIDNIFTGIIKHTVSKLGVVGIAGSTGAFVFGSGATPATPDVGISRDSAGVLDVGDGTQGNAGGTVKAATVILSGATFQLNGKTCAIVATVLTCT